jgi:peroxiredoxin Q/BCP
VQVIGASVDSVKANAGFAQKHGLRFPLLCDPDHVVVAAFGVEKQPGGSARRTTFLIDPDGALRRVWWHVTAAGHAAEVLEAARAIWGTEG